MEILAKNDNDLNVNECWVDFECDYDFCVGHCNDCAECRDDSDDCRGYCNDWL